MESEANQDLDCDLDPSKDDLPLRANTNHMLVRHYVLDLTVCFSSEVISGSVVLFLEPGKGAGLRPDSSSSITDHAPGDEKASGSVGQAGGGGRDRSRTEEAGTFQDASKNVTVEGGGGGGGGNVGGDCCHSDPLPSPMAAERLSWEHRGDDDDFVLVLDCCDLVVSKVEEVHLASIPEMCSLEGGGDSCSGGASTNTLVRKLVSMPSSHWAKQQELYSLCSCAPALPGGGAIQFCTDRWSLQIRKRGFRTPQTFPLALRIWYQTKPQGASVRWTKDQSGRPCVYTQGSPINNRALFPCQEPPVAMSTWQASIHALSDSIGYWVEAKASPTSSTKTCPNIAMQNVGVALSKPGSLEIMTCTLGGEPGVVQKLCSEMDYSDLTDVTQTLHSEVDCFGLGSDDMNLNSGMNYSGLAKEEQTKHCGVDYSGLSTEEQNSNSGMECSGLADPESCCHSDYPCRFPDTVAQAQSVIPHRVFAPPTLLQRAESMLLPLLPHCLAAAHTTLGVHPFARLDVLIVPPGFSSLGMARSVAGMAKWLRPAAPYLSIGPAPVRSAPPLDLCPSTPTRHGGKTCRGHSKRRVAA
ncbi:hypothetical protein JZ751_018875 [Albula glossodonta]|uniref:Uncharacterized protein n=1 Tax=Albula glossodonta TaxID=121402 RepID=A0A8T2MTP7_9TELE|nr:hypothetical protein JZ751_018875 [Albula glossodonta]